MTSTSHCWSNILFENSDYFEYCIFLKDNYLNEIVRAISMNVKVISIFMHAKMMNRFKMQ